MVRITNISTAVNKEDFALDIIERNQLPSNLVNIGYANKNTNYGALAKTTCDAYSKILRSKTVFVGYENCKVYDVFNINRYMWDLLQI